MLLFFVALLEEAKPLIERYNLQKKQNIYVNDQIKLIITGCGPFNACKMVERYGSKEDLFVNIGTCYSNDQDVGSLFVVGKVSMGKQSLFPKFSFRVKQRIASIKTVMEPKESYNTPSLVDMESYGFFFSANAFVPAEEILLIKIVSDNDQSPFVKGRVRSLISSHIDTIDSLISKMQKRPQKDYSLFFDKWHFTSSEQSIIKDLLHSKDVKDTYDQVKSFREKERVLNFLKREELLFL